MLRNLLMIVAVVLVAFVALSLVTDINEPQRDDEMCAAAEAAGVDAERYRETLCDPEKAAAIREALDG